MTCVCRGPQCFCLLLLPRLLVLPLLCQPKCLQKCALPSACEWHWLFAAVSRVVCACCVAKYSSCKLNSWDLNCFMSLLPSIWVQMLLFTIMRFTFSPPHSHLMPHIKMTLKWQFLGKQREGKTEWSQMKWGAHQWQKLLSIPELPHLCVHVCGWIRKERSSGLKSRILCNKIMISGWKQHSTDLLIEFLVRKDLFREEIRHSQ